MERLKNFIMRHPYPPIAAMVVLDVVGYAIEGTTVDPCDDLLDLVKKWMTRLCAAFYSLSAFVEFFPEEIFVAITAYGLSRKMRTFKEETREVDDIVAKVTETGRAMTHIWGNRNPPGPADQTTAIQRSEEPE